MRLAINRLKERRRVDRFLARNELPIVEGDRCTFLWRGDADAVRLVHRITGLPDRVPLRRIRGAIRVVKVGNNTTYCSSSAAFCCMPAVFKHARSPRACAAFSCRPGTTLSSPNNQNSGMSAEHFPWDSFL